MVKVNQNLTDIEKKGWLLKWTNYFKRYQRRWFVLSKGLLSYYRNEAEATHTCRGSIKLASAVIHVDVNCDFVISNGGTVIFHLRAKNESERHAWVFALARSKLIANNIQESEEEYYQKHCLGTKELNQFHEIFEPLNAKLENIKNLNSQVIKRSAALQESIKKLEDVEKSIDSEVAMKYKTMSEKAIIFRISTIPLYGACEDFYKLGKELVPKFEKILLREQEYCKNLQKTLEQLAEQHSILEDRVKKEVAASNAAAKINLNTDDEEEFFEDAVTEFELPYPGKAHRTTASEYSESANLESLVTNESNIPKDFDGSSGSEDFNSQCNDNFEDNIDVAGASDNQEWILKSNSLEDHQQFSPSTSKKDLDNLDKCSNNPSSHLNTNEKDEFFFEEDCVIQFDPKRRTRIPERPNESLNIWSIMKNCIGKELTKIPMPVNFNEPLSMLQRLSEDFEYAELLHKAAKISDSCNQLIYIAAFCVSSYAATSNRVGKPFNPLLGETFECDRTSDLGWRCITEQVSHHPPMMASYCEGRDWICWSEFAMSSKFRGKYLQVNPLDISHLEFPKLGYHYTWRKVTTSIHNIIVGRLWVDHYGDMVIVNNTTGDRCLLNFTPYSYFSRDVQRKIMGSVIASNGELKWILQGTWDTKLEAIKVHNRRKTSKNKPLWDTFPPKLIWKRRMPPPEYDKIYNMTLLAIQMNEPEEGVCPTDSRNRPDQRLMEEGQWTKANMVKLLLEEKQRMERRKREEEAANNPSSVEAYSPVWFQLKKDPITNNPVYIYSGEYWKCKEKQDWSKCPDIYSYQDIENVKLKSQEDE